MTKAAIYARYSSDKQSGASIDDQIRLCEEHAAREGESIAERYSDAAIFGRVANTCAGTGL
jgi:site-specific DNA recombinase